MYKMLGLIKKNQKIIKNMLVKFYKKEYVKIN